jgi:hypothetical protein
MEKARNAKNAAAKKKESGTKRGAAFDLLEVEGLAGDAEALARRQVAVNDVVD